MLSLSVSYILSLHNFKKSILIKKFFKSRLLKNSMLNVKKNITSNSRSHRRWYQRGKNWTSCILIQFSIVQLSSMHHAYLFLHNQSIKSVMYSFIYLFTKIIFYMYTLIPWFSIWIYISCDRAYDDVKKYMLECTRIRIISSRTTAKGWRVIRWKNMYWIHVALSHFIFTASRVWRKKRTLKEGLYHSKIALVIMFHRNVHDLLIMIIPINVFYIIINITYFIIFYNCHKIL